MSAMEAHQAQPARETQVDQQNQELQAAVEWLHDVLDQLERRLTPVLSFEDTPADDKTVPQAMLAPLADALRIRVGQVRSACFKVQGITGRLEV